MRIITKSRGHFHGTHKGATIIIDRDPDGTFYIIVTGKSGGHLYDGWAPHHIRTMLEAKREAVRGACLDDPWRPQAARAAAGIVTARGDAA
ncbi:MAG: hypothetical protein JO107_14840 [Hyphomicrobiales bacterium]|nr:hypothetical protein [Hyphomicrobiales bacterium]MBV8664367.1 hypothetical protein [Hyphomicrobiales bacterium]